MARLPQSAPDRAARRCRLGAGRRSYRSSMSHGSTAFPRTGVAVTELVKAEVCGLEVFVDTVRYEEGSSQLWLLSLSGQASAVRGAWANLTGFHSFLKLVDSDKLLSLAGGGVGWR